MNSYIAPQTGSFCFLRFNVSFCLFIYCCLVSLLCYPSVAHTLKIWPFHVAVKQFRSSRNSVNDNENVNFLEERANLIAP